MSEEYQFLTPQEAWASLVDYRTKYYKQYGAAYSGNRRALRETGAIGSFWRRGGKTKMHVELAGDIAATSADLLFAEEPIFEIEHEQDDTLRPEAEAALLPRQARLDQLIADNGLHGKLNEGAESCAMLGDVFIKLNWWPDELDFPVLSIVQGDSAWAEYVLGQLQCIHFFSVARYDPQSGKYVRAYERYEKGRITMAMFLGSEGDLGADMGDEALAKYGFEREITCPVDEMCAVHIPNMRPNRKFRDSPNGRSDLDGLRDQLDALDEAYTSWMRDVRLAKARLIIPAEYLRRKPSDLFSGDRQFTYEFDEDVETMVALDINPQDGSGNPITASQFAIRADEFMKTCSDLIRNIVSEAGYSPQSFGLDINGNAQSGTALKIREKKSFNTRNKKQTYWRAPLETILTTMVHLDAALYPGEGSLADDAVTMTFSDTMSSDISTMATAIRDLNSAMALSTDLKVQMLHPDWTQKQIIDEVQRIKEENGLSTSPIPELGDFHTPIDQTTNEDQGQEQGGES